MTNSYNYFVKLRDNASDLDMEQYAVAFTHAVVEFACFNRGQAIGYLNNLVKECDFDVDKAIDRVNVERLGRMNKPGRKYNLVFEGDDD